jgi:hypothetical protein
LAMKRGSSKECAEFVILAWSAAGKPGTEIESMLDFGKVDQKELTRVVLEPDMAADENCAWGIPMGHEKMRRTAQLRCPFLDCKSKQFAWIRYDNSSVPQNKSLSDHDENLFQCQECGRKFLYTGKL